MVCLNHRLNPSTPSPLPGACVPATAGTHAELLVYYYQVCTKRTFLRIGIFCSSARGPFLVLSVEGHAGGSREHCGASVGPGRGPWDVLWGVKVANTGK